MGLKKKNSNGTDNGSVTEKKKSKFKEKLDMYDMILANLIAGKSIIEPSVHLDNSQVAIGFSNISSETQLSKYFCINAFSDYVPEKIFDAIRNRCMNSGIKINFYTYSYPYKINRDSADMRNKMSIWENYSREHSSSVRVFQYRNDINEAKARERIITSTKYLNESELIHKRSLARVAFIIEVTANRDEDSLINMTESIRALNEYCNTSGIKIKELRVNMIDWIRAISPFSLNANKETDYKLAKKVMTDDNLANFGSYKQGKVGLKGIPLGIDIKSYSVVLRMFKDNPDKAENWLVTAETGGGKSMWMKSLLPYFFAAGYTICVMDYEGDEYTNFANFARQCNPDDVKVVSMGKGSAVYFDPCAIPDLTGDDTVDSDLKENAISFITAIFRIIVKGSDDDFTTEERKILTTAIQRMYDSALVTDEPETWKRSKSLRLHDVYKEVKDMVITKEFIDDADDNAKHKAAQAILDASSVYFEDGEANSYMFKQPMSADELYKAKLVVFSFGMRGVSDSATDPTMLALKQLSVAYVNINISNHCKYVKHCFNVKVWEEFQRWGQTRGSAETIANAITGGRKRGDVNFILTNDLAALLSETNELSSRLTDNIQNYVVGKIKNKKTRDKFCETFDLQDVEVALDTIAKASTVTKQIGKKLTGTQNKYQNSFCVILDDGNKAIVKSMLPDAILKSSLFKTGVQIE